MVKEIYNHWLPAYLGAEAVTIKNTIYYKRSKLQVWDSLRKHEMKHVEQYKKYGLLGFLVIYLTWYLIGRFQGKDDLQAYLDIPFEVEARKAEREG
jgi:hypothetical protein